METTLPSPGPFTVRQTPEVTLPGALPFMIEGRGPNGSLDLIGYTREPGDAVLFAAAPDMLAELEQLAIRAQRFGMTVDKETLDLIARAKGGRK